MKKIVKNAIENVLSQYAFEFNTPEVRKEIVNSLYEAARIPFDDLTTVEDVNHQTFRFQGYDEKTNKMIQLIVQPATIKYKEFYESI
jgi:uncharacterized protein YfbU (UPF0304 family)